MRRLWIRRDGSAAARFSKMSVYIEDYEQGDTLINDVACRKLGVIKNDQQKHYNIDADEARAFVVAGKGKKNREYEFVRIPEGEDDVFFSGRCVGVPFSGKIFRFDGVTDEQILRGRKKANRKGILALLAVILAVVLVAAGVGAVMFLDKPVISLPFAAEEEPAAETFRVEDLQITLTDAFSAGTAAGYDACFTASDVAVFVKKEDFSLAEGLGDLTVEDYGALVLKNNQLQDTAVLHSGNGYTGFTYRQTGRTTGKTYEYNTALFKGPDAFWMVQFSTLAENGENYQKTFEQWAQTVRFE